LVEHLTFNQRVPGSIPGALTKEDKDLSQNLERPVSAGEVRPELEVLFWADIDLPPGLELRELTKDDLHG
jgi:hypothetical protein